jgi:hypothetical protein
MELGSEEFWDQLHQNPARLAYEIAQIDLTDLQSTLQRHPALRAWVSATYENARIVEERAKWELTKIKAIATLQAKATVDADTNKNKTVAVLDAEVETNEAVLAAVAVLLEAQEKRATLKAMVDSLEDRVQMLVQLAARQREESRDYR